MSSLQSFTLSMGAELRLEKYQIKQGDDPSWKKGTLQNTDVGASGREGFSDVSKCFIYATGGRVSKRIRLPFVKVTSTGGRRNLRSQAYKFTSSCLL